MKRVTVDRFKEDWQHSIFICDCKVLDGAGRESVNVPMRDFINQIQDENGDVKEMYWKGGKLNAWHWYFFKRGSNPIDLYRVLSDVINKDRNPPTFAGDLGGLLNHLTNQA